MKNNYFFCFIRKLLALFVMSICFIVPSLTVQAGDLVPVGNYCLSFGDNVGYADSNPLIISAFAIDNKYIPIYGEYYSNPISGSGVFDKDNNTLKITFTTSQLEPLSSSQQNVFMSIYTLLLNLNNEDWQGDLQYFSVSPSFLGVVGPTDNTPEYVVRSATGYVKTIPCN